MFAYRQLYFDLREFSRLCRDRSEARAGNKRARKKELFLLATGLAEGIETILSRSRDVHLFPTFVTLIASVFAVLCLITVLQRSWIARRALC